MTQFCNPQPYEVKRCPDCQSIVKEPPIEGKKKCNKCLQFVIFEGGVATKAVPKDMF